MKNVKNWTSERFFRRLDYFLDIKGWSISKLTNESFISEGALYSCRKRNSIPTIRIICKLCETLDISLAEFFDDENEGIVSEDLQKQVYLAMLRILQEHGKIFEDKNIEEISNK